MLKIIVSVLLSLFASSVCSADFWTEIQTNKTRGTVNIVKGDAKIAAGKLTNKKLLVAKGRAEKLVGEIQRAVGKDQKSRGE